MWQERLARSLMFLSVVFAAGYILGRMSVLL